VLIRDLTAEDRAWLRDLIDQTWGLPVVSLSGEHDLAHLEGFDAEVRDERLGVLTYVIASQTMEVVTLNRCHVAEEISNTTLEGYGMAWTPAASPQTCP
jgi:hypothetical protein